MDVSVDAAPWCDWAPVSAYLQQLGLSVVPSGQGSGESKQQETGLVLLLHAPLAVTLQQAAAEGVLPETAVEEWQRAVEKMMHFCRQNRSRAIMVSLDDLLAAPDAFIDCCQARGFEVKPPTTELQLAPVAITPIFELFAQSLLLSRKPLRKVVQQLEALSQPLRDLPEARQPDLGAVLQAYLDGRRAVVRAQELSERLRALENELGVAQDNLGAVKRQLETAQREGRRQQDKLTAEIDAQRRAYQAVNDESTLLLEQLHQVQETLEKTLQDQQKAARDAQSSEQAKDKKIKILREEIHNLTQQIEKNREVENNLTSELNSVRSQVSSAREEVTESQQENSLILEQLHLVQESYEQLLLQQQEAAPGADLYNRVEALRQSGWFDEAWYLQQYPDVRESGTDPVEHYLRYGARFGRNPGPDFDTKRYLERYPDVAEAGLNPLYHFVLYGQYENRLASC